MAAAAGPTHFYVWYTVNAELPKAFAVVAALLTAVEDATGVAGRVLARRDDPSTWMEIYEHVDDANAFDRRLAALAREHGALEIAAEGRRHVERFAAVTDALA